MKKAFILIAMVFAMVGAVQAQFLTMGLKLSYGSADPQEIIGGVQDEVQNFNTDFFIQKCNLGVAARLKFGKHLFVQPEANFSINSVWSNIDSNATLMEQVSGAFSDMQSVSLSIPVLLGYKIFEIEDFLAFRAFLGPEFYTSIDVAGEEGFNFETWSAIAGVGIDIANTVYIDVRATYLNASDHTDEVIPAGAKGDGESGKFMFSLGLGFWF